MAEPKKPELFTVWPFTEKFADPCCIPLGWGKEGGEEERRQVKGERGSKVENVNE